MTPSRTLASRCEAALAPRAEQKILPGLDRIQSALASLGHPERAFRSLLVLGTNGKGSTAALIASIVARHGVRVGLYTSPHLLHVEERIVVDGALIPQDSLLALIASLGRFQRLSYFETLTAAAFLHFAAAGVELAVLEAGLGGRWDASNAGAPDITLLTNVGTDHQAWLGTTRAEIAAEKAAALRGREAIVGAWDAEVEPAIRAGADPSTPLSSASDWASVDGDREPGTGNRDGDPVRRQPAASAHGPRPTAHAFPAVDFTVAGVHGSAVLPLLGRHQEANLTLALAGVAALTKHGITPALRQEAIAEGIGATRWPGRLQWVESQGRRLLLDGAHNREAMLALADALDRLGLSGKVNLLFSCLADKPLAAMAKELRPRVRRVLVAPIESPRATPVDALAGALPGCETHASVAAALAHLPADAPTLVTGSLRLVGEVLRLTGEDGGA